MQSNWYRTVALSMVLAAPAANACQLVCITTPYALVGGADTTAARDAACSAAKTGFKPAVEGMLSALPGDVTPFIGTVNGPTCAASASTPTLIKGLAQAIYESTPNNIPASFNSAMGVNATMYSFFSQGSGFGPGTGPYGSADPNGGSYRAFFDSTRYFPALACSASAKLTCCNM